MSDTALFLCQAPVSSTMSHFMTNRQWVALLYFFARQSHQSCPIPWPTGSEWHCFISDLPGSLIMSHSTTNSMQVTLLYYLARQWVILPCFFAISLIMSHATTNRPVWQWVTLLYFFARQSHQLCHIPLWLTVCEWNFLPGSLIWIRSHAISWSTASEWLIFVRLSHQSYLCFFAHHLTIPYRL